MTEEHPLRRRVNPETVVSDGYILDGVITIDGVSYIGANALDILVRGDGLYALGISRDVMGFGMLLNLDVPSMRALAKELTSAADTIEQHTLDLILKTR